MAKKLYEESNIQNIANAIREKNGKNATKYKTSEMAAAIINLAHGIPSEAFTITDGNYTFSNDQWTWFLEQYGNNITTQGLYDTIYMFASTTGRVNNIEEIPFDINYSSYGYDFNASNMFRNCYLIKKLPNFNNFIPLQLDSFCAGCYSLNDISSLLNIDFTTIQRSRESLLSNIFNYCYSLRSIPADLMQELYVPQYPTATLNRRSILNGFVSCITLDELINIPISNITAELTENIFAGIAANCYRLKALTFTTSASVRQWSNQYIDLITLGTVESSSADNITKYNSGITEATRITDDATYQTLKDDPDSWTTDAAYSRYNRTSAYQTICSLPNASRGSNNIIRFRGLAGSSTDGGAINTMTEEEIAIATAKGWTVSFTNN